MGENRAAAAAFSTPGAAAGTGAPGSAPGADAGVGRGCEGRGAPGLGPGGAPRGLPSPGREAEHGWCGGTGSAGSLELSDVPEGPKGTPNLQRRRTGAGGSAL